MEPTGLVPPLLCLSTIERYAKLLWRALQKGRESCRKCTVPFTTNRVQTALRVAVRTEAIILLRTI